LPLIVDSQAPVILPKTGELKVGHVLPLLIPPLPVPEFALTRTGKEESFRPVTVCGCEILVEIQMPLAPFLQ